MIISGHQPGYLPWPGLFEKIISSDLFVIHDTAQFETSGFLHRNKIKFPQGASWLTVPVDAHGFMHRSLLDIRIHEELNWRRKHWKSIRTSYARAPYMKRYEAFFEDFYAHNWISLVDMNMSFIRFIMKDLHIETPIEFISHHPGIVGKKSDFVLSLCKYFGADTCYLGSHGQDYINSEDFKAAKVNLLFQDYVYPRYQQLFGDFIPNLSIIDILLNCGPDQTKELLLTGRRVIFG